MESMDVNLEEIISHNENTHSEVSNEREEKLKFECNTFSGPLDLLLYLVKQNKIDIFDIPIAELSDQYLKYLNEILVYDLGDLTEFYKTAALLLHIKSRTLLPVHVDMDEDEIDTSRAELINTLIEFQKYKKLSDMLFDRYEQFNWLSLRQETNILPLDFPQEDMWKEVKSLELFSVFMNLMDKPEIPQRIIDLNEPVTISEKMALIYEYLEKQQECFFDDIVAGGGVMAVVCALFALLELMKQQQVKALQHSNNGEIRIVRGNP